MKSKLFRLSAALACAAAICAVGVFCGCGEDTPEEGDGGNFSESGRWNIAEFVAQNEEAKKIYNSIYDGLSDNVSAFSYAHKLSAAADDALSLDDVLALLADRLPNTSTDVVSLINTYIADIYSYSQIQLSLIEEYEGEALIGSFNVDYSNVDWGANIQANDYTDIQLKNMLLFLSRVKPVKAQFVGVNMDTDRVYLAQMHEVSGDNTNAKLEYFWDEQTGDIGVTTLNWHYSQQTGEFTKFEYHFCDAVNSIVVTAVGTMDENSRVSLSSVTIYTLKGVFSKWDEDIRDIVFDYVLSEIDRIEGEIDSLAAQNAAIVDRAENFEVPEDPRTISVNYDYDVLRGMIKL